MASIIKRGKSYRAQVSLSKNGKQSKLTKTFPSKNEAELWALKMELDKGNGKQLAEQNTTFADYFENWVYLIKFHDVKETTFQNYVRSSSLIRKLFGNLQLKNLNDMLIQSKIDEYAKTHSRSTTHKLILQIRGALRDAYARGYIPNDFSTLLKIRGVNPPKRNRALSITDLQKLRKYTLEHPEDEFNIFILLALETGMRRGELLAIRPESMFEYGIKVRHSISPTSDDTSLKTKNAKRDVSINKNVYELIRRIPVKSNGYIFNPYGFKQSEKLAELLQLLNIPKTTFHGLRDTHASFLFSQEIDLVYISKRLGHCNIQTTQNYYISLLDEKKHQQDADALELLNSL